MAGGVAVGVEVGHHLLRLLNTPGGEGSVGGGQPSLDSEQRRGWETREMVGPLQRLPLVS